jgi:hypothetical protein
MKSLRGDVETMQGAYHSSRRTMVSPSQADLHDILRLPLIEDLCNTSLISRTPARCSTSHASLSGSMKMRRCRET